MARHLLFLLTLLCGLNATATISKSKSDVNAFMTFVGWPDTQKYEETNLKIKDLLNQMVAKDAKSYAWLKQLNRHFASPDYKSKNTVAQRHDIIEAKIYAKLALREILKIPIK
jgi:hypothetical protein